MRDDTPPNYRTFASCAEHAANARVTLAELARQLVEFDAREQALRGEQRDLLQRSASIAGKVARGMSQSGALVADREQEGAVAHALAGLQDARRDLRYRIEQVKGQQNSARHNAVQHLAAAERAIYREVAARYTASWARLQALHELGADPPGPAWGVTRLPGLEADNAPSGLLLHGVQGDSRGHIDAATARVQRELSEAGLLGEPK